MLLVSQEIILVLLETQGSLELWETLELRETLELQDLTRILEYEDLTGTQENVAIQDNQDDVHVVECQDNRQYVSGLTPNIIMKMSGHAFLLCKSKSAIPSCLYSDAIYFYVNHNLYPHLYYLYSVFVISQKLLWNFIRRVIQDLTAKMLEETEQKIPYRNVNIIYIV